MNKLTILLLSLTACSKVFPTDGRFTCVDVNSYKLGYYKYRMESVKGRGIFYMIDSANKYIVGDTLELKPISK
jgi:hypothetical protein